MTKKGRQILPYMNNVVNEQKERNLNLINFVRCYCFLLEETIEHDGIFLPHCFCFQCSFRSLLREVMIERDDQKFLFVINIHNFNDDDNDVIIKKMLYEKL